MPPPDAGRAQRAADRLFHGWKVVAACFVVAAVSWGLALYGSSVYVQALSAAHGWPVATVASAVSLMYLVAALMQRPVAGAIERWGSRPVLASGALALCAGVASLGLIDQPAQLLACFLLIGMGWSCLSTTGLSVTVNPWFERHQGRSITLAVMGASIGAIVGVPAILASIDALGLRQGLLATALVGLAIILPLILWVLRYRGPTDIGAWPDGATAPPSVPPSIPPSALASAPVGAAPGGGAQTEAAPPAPGSVWVVAVAFAVALMVQLGFLTHHLALAMQTMSQSAGGSLISATGVAALLGRIVLAKWVDRMPVRNVAATMMLLQAGALLAIALWPGQAVMVVASLAYGFAVGYVTTLAPVIVRREQGRAQFSARYGAAASLMQFTSACGPWLFGLLHEALGGYRLVLALAALAALAAAAVLAAGRR